MEISFLFLFFLVAFLYASVGHGGASGYIGVMILMELSPAFIKPYGLMMNLMVSLIAFLGFYKAGYFRLSLFWPLILTSAPMAYMGGVLSLSDPVYKKVLAICLVIAIIQLLYKFKKDGTTQTMPVLAGLFSGGLIGLLSGMIGIGGGIILSPLLLWMRWTSIKEAAAIAALFIFVNSFMGLMGFLSTKELVFTPQLFYALFAIAIGGSLGSYSGSHKFNSPTLKIMLAAVLTIAVFKLVSN